GKGKDKQVYILKSKNPKPSAKEHPAKDDTCHHCKEVGHWKRNCLVYLAELIKKKKQVGTASSSDVFIIELFSFPTKSWVYDTSCGTHICNTKHGLGGVRKTETSRSYWKFDLVLPNGLVICLDNSHYAPSIIRGVVSVHRLVENGFVKYFTDYGILVSKNNVFYFNAIPSNSIYEIDKHDLVPNVNSIYNKRIEKLQQEGLLKSTDDESIDQCVSCLSGKMIRKSFPHRPERATDLLGIIHTDVSRQCASYFITFTDDYSLYGYVYLLKHKHELTPPYTPQHNDVSERRNHTFVRHGSIYDESYNSAVILLGLCSIQYGSNQEG
ncbi:retrotransposon protein, putative, ty1-copia subclass, partial [Tanacetum coccineum]